MRHFSVRRDCLDREGVGGTCGTVDAEVTHPCLASLDIPSREGILFGPHTACRKIPSSGGVVRPPFDSAQAAEEAVQRGA